MPLKPIDGPAAREASRPTTSATAEERRVQGRRARRRARRAARCAVPDRSRREWSGWTSGCCLPSCRSPSRASCLLCGAAPLTHMHQRRNDVRIENDHLPSPAGREPGRATPGGPPPAPLSRSGRRCASPTWVAGGFLPYGIPQDVANFFFHAAPMAFGPALQSCLDVVFEVTNDELAMKSSRAIQAIS